MTSYQQIIDAERWANGLAYGKQEPGDSLHLFRAIRIATAAMLGALPDTAWTNKSVFQDRDVSLLDVVNQCSDHVEFHVRQINDIRCGLASSA